MKISIIGIGRLGLCLALCFEKSGYEVLGMDLRENYVNNCVIKGTDGEIVIPNPWIQNKKTFIEIKNKKKYYKKFISSDKSTYAYQVEKVSKSFESTMPIDQTLFDIYRS